MEKEKVYTGTYRVVKVFRDSYRRNILKRGLTKEEAKKIVNSFPDSNTSMVVFEKQFTSEKYYK